MAIKQRKKSFFLASIIGCVLVAYGLIQLTLWLNQTMGTAPPPDPQAIVRVDVDKPSEKKPNIAEYSVPADMPTIITAPSIGMSALIQNVGLTDGKALAAPSNVHFAGWYIDSVKPGESGLSIIDGHVSGRYAPGIFRDLSKLKSGDKIEVEYGDGTKRQFEVVEGKTVQTSEAAEILFTHQQEIKSQLNLITCDGNYDRKSEQYDKRHIVIAKSLN